MRQLCAICSDRVDSCSLSAASADRTSAADSLRRGWDPSRSVSGLTPSRYNWIVRADRLDSPCSS
jgi:hypothetical protein